MIDKTIRRGNRNMRYPRISLYSGYFYKYEIPMLLCYIENLAKVQMLLYNNKKDNWNKRQVPLCDA